MRKTLNLKLILNKLRGKFPEKGETDNRILRETMSLSISRLILKPCQNEIGHRSKIVWDFCVDVTSCNDSPTRNIHFNEAKLRTCIGTNNNCSLSHVLKSIFVSLSMKIINLVLKFKLRKGTMNINLLVPKINLSLKIHILLLGHQW